MLTHLKIKGLWPGYHQTMLEKVRNLTHMVCCLTEEYYYNGVGPPLGVLKHYYKGEEQKYDKIPTPPWICLKYAEEAPSFGGAPFGGGKKTPTTNPLKNARSHQQKQTHC